MLKYVVRCEEMYDNVHVDSYFSNVTHYSMEEAKQELEEAKEALKHDRNIINVYISEENK